MVVSIVRRAATGLWRAAARNATTAAEVGLSILPGTATSPNQDRIPPGAQIYGREDSNNEGGQQTEDKPQNSPSPPLEPTSPPSEVLAREPEPWPRPKPDNPPVTQSPPDLVVGARKPNPQIPDIELPSDPPDIPQRRIKETAQTFDEQSIQFGEKKLVKVKKDALERTYGRLMASPISNSAVVIQKSEVPNPPEELDPLKNAKKFYEQLIRLIHNGTWDSDTLAALSLNFIPSNFFKYLDGGQLIATFGEGILGNIAREFLFSSYNAFQSIDGQAHINVKFVDRDRDDPDSITDASIGKLVPNLGLESNKITEKIYQILGGDDWFSDSETPKLVQNSLESKLRNSATTQQLNNGQGQQAISNNLIQFLTNLISIPYYRGGYGEYPAQLPEHLRKDLNTDTQQVTGGGGGQIEEERTTKLYNQGQLWEWWIKAFDEIMGEFPVQFKIKDNDLIKTGNDSGEQDLSFPNVAELMAELMNNQIKSESLVNTNLNANLRALGEIGSNKQINVKSHALLEAISEYLGYKSGKERKEVQFLFNPIDTTPDENGNNGDESISRALQNKTVEVEVETNTDGQTLEQKLDTLIEAARIVKSQSFRSFNQGTSQPAIRDQIKDLVKAGSQFLDNGAQAQDSNQGGDDAVSDFDNYLDKIERGFTGQAQVQGNEPYGREFERRPKIREVGNEQNQQSDG